MNRKPVHFLAALAALTASACSTSTVVKPDWEPTSTVPDDARASLDFTTPRTLAYRTETITAAGRSRTAFVLDLDAGSATLRDPGTLVSPPIPGLAPFTTRMKPTGDAIVEPGKLLFGELVFFEALPGRDGAPKRGETWVTRSPTDAEVLAMAAPNVVVHQRERRFEVLGFAHNPSTGHHIATIEMGQTGGRVESGGMPATAPIPQAHCLLDVDVTSATLVGILCEIPLAKNRARDAKGIAEGGPMKTFCSVLEGATGSSETSATGPRPDFCASAER